MPIWTGSRPKGSRSPTIIAVDLFSVETALWPRYGVNGAAVHLKGRGDFANMFVFDIPPGGSTAAAAPPLRGRGLRAGGHRLDPDRIFRRQQEELRMGPAQPVRHSAQRQAPAFQRPAARARAARHHHRPAAGDEHLPRRPLRVRDRPSISPTAPARTSISPARAISSPCAPATTCGRPISSPTSPPSS